MVRRATSVASKRNKASTTINMENLELKIPPVVVTFIFAFLMWLVSIQLPQGSMLVLYSIILAIIFLVGGVVIALAGVLSFHLAKTTVNPTKPNASSTIVRSGIYRFSRNPMYLGLLLVLVGWLLLLSNLIAFVLLPLYIVYMNRFQIIPEERILTSKFNNHYNDYKRSVRRWF